MTAEIAVLNKEAVALSADSASTVVTGAGPKVFNSVSKIFGLTKAEPVGIMIYGKATFLGVPWETIIRAFRDKREPKARDHLSEYGAEFIEFIENWPEMFPPEAQQDYVAKTIQTYFAYLLDRIAREIESAWQIRGPLTRSQGKTITREVIAAHHELWKGAPDADGGLAGKAAEIRSKHVGQIKEARLEIFAKARISSASATRLSEIAGWLFTKQPPHGVHPDLSGVVVAGFGAEDYFPSLASYEFEGMALDSVKYTKDRSIDIDRSADAAAIVPFAQRDSVRAFMEGIHPSASAAVAQEIDRLLMAYPEDVLEQAGVSRQTRTKVLKAFAGQRDTEWDRITRVLTDHISNEHIDPVVDIVSVLPKDELAMMAESLVNLTSFRHRVSFGAETVGGPIDVAVISKGDGFVWIKRKHYFKQELNPQFVARKYGGPA